jgi:hypothetical protein
MGTGGNIGFVSSNTHDPQQYLAELDLPCTVRQCERVIDEHERRLALPAIAARNLQSIWFKGAPLTKYPSDVVADALVDDDDRPLSGIGSYSAHVIIVKMAEHDVTNRLAGG